MFIGFIYDEIGPTYLNAVLSPAVYAVYLTNEQRYLNNLFIFICICLLNCWPFTKRRKNISSSQLVLSFCQNGRLLHSTCENIFHSRNTEKKIESRTIKLEKKQYLT